jgi:circadian clock protein KaiC
MELIDELKPKILCIDSFKAIRDLMDDEKKFRKLVYDLSVNLSAAKCTAFLIGEYDYDQMADDAEFAVADGIIHVYTQEISGEEHRLLRVLKLRGQPVSLAPYPFKISRKGIELLAPSLTLKRRETGTEVDEERVQTCIPGLDELLNGGIPRGHSIILSGVSGTGKTTLTIQFLYKGAEMGEKGLLISFEETPDRLRKTAESFGFDLYEMERRNLIKIMFIPQTDISVEENLNEIVRLVKDFKPNRIVMDSLSIFLHKVRDPALQREKIYHFASLVQMSKAAGIFISDIPAGENKLSRFGVEETVVDGVIVLSTEMEGLKRRRYIEVYKMRGSDHVTGRYRMEITPRGLEVFYLTPNANEDLTPQVLRFSPLKAIIQKDINFGSAWLIRGEEGAGRSTLAYQFAIEGLKCGESVLFIAVDDPVGYVRNKLESWQIEVEPYLESGHLCFLDTFSKSEDYVDISDSELFIYEVHRRLKAMPKPCRIIIDSLLPIAVYYTPEDLIKFLEKKNRLLKSPDVALLDTFMAKTLEESTLYSMLNSYDVVLDLYIPDWGEMSQAGKQGIRVLQIRKAPDAVDTRPYPYFICPGKGVIVQKEFYR